MKVSKIIAFTAALSLTAMLMTACGNNNADTAETTTAAVTTTLKESLPIDLTETETEETTEETAENEYVADNEEPSASDMLQFSETENPLRPVIEAVVSQGEWPFLSEVTDEMIISDYFTLDKNNENYEQSIFMQCPMSANLTEVIVIKAADPEAAKADLEVRQKKAQDTDAFYPADIERANSSIVGTEGSYAYFLMCSNSSEVETVLVEALKAL
ncbi:MAG: DUF4358 domain-containing protein [Oscillospiraceae bacterium]